MKRGHKRKREPSHAPLKRKGENGREGNEGTDLFNEIDELILLHEKNSSKEAKGKKKKKHGTRNRKTPKTSENNEDILNEIEMILVSGLAPSKTTSKEKTKRSAKTAPVSEPPLPPPPPPVMMDEEPQTQKAIKDLKMEFKFREEQMNGSKSESDDSRAKSQPRYQEHRNTEPLVHHRDRRHMIDTAAKTASPVLGKLMDQGDVDRICARSGGVPIPGTVSPPVTLARGKEDASDPLPSGDGGKGNNRTRAIAQAGLRAIQGHVVTMPKIEWEKAKEAAEAILRRRQLSFITCNGNARNPSPLSSASGAHLASMAGRSQDRSFEFQKAAMIISCLEGTRDNKSASGIGADTDRKPPVMMKFDPDTFDALFRRYNMTSSVFKSVIDPLKIDRDIKLPDLGQPCSKSYCAQFLRAPLGEDFGERTCIAGPDQCVCTLTAPVWPPSIKAASSVWASSQPHTANNNNCVTLTPSAPSSRFTVSERACGGGGFVGREFLRPEQLEQWRTTGALPKKRGLCLMCLRFETTAAFAAQQNDQTTTTSQQHRTKDGAGGAAPSFFVYQNHYNSASDDPSNPHCADSLLSVTHAANLHGSGGGGDYVMADMLPHCDPKHGNMTGIIKPIVMWRADRYEPSYAQVKITCDNGMTCAHLGSRSSIVSVSAAAPEPPTKPKTTHGSGGSESNNTTTFIATIKCFVERGSDFA